MSPLSATYWGIPGYIIFWVLFARCLWLICAESLFSLPPDASGEAGEPLRQNRAENQEYAGRGCHAAVQPEKRYP